MRLFLMVFAAAFIAVAIALAIAHHYGIATTTTDPMQSRLDRTVNAQGTQCWQTPQPWLCDPTDYDNYGTTTP